MAIQSLFKFKSDYSSSLKRHQFLITAAIEILLKANTFKFRNVQNSLYPGKNAVPSLVTAYRVTGPLADGWQWRHQSQSSWLAVE